MASSTLTTQIIKQSNYVFILGSKELDVKKIRIDSLMCNSIAVKPLGTGYQDMNGDNQYDLILRFSTVPTNLTNEIKGKLYDGTPFIATTTLLPHQKTQQQTKFISKPPFPQRRRGGCCGKRAQ
ncbi:MAG TPA: hypothetical protein DDY49_12705 [Paenibacillaceae bacterium]|nr:hypothetical protein [Paenibacillaceae bacterium]